MTNQSFRNQRGVIVPVYMVLVGFLVASVSVASVSVTEHRNAQRAFGQAQAFYAAEAGLDQALVRMREDPDYAGTAYSALMVDGEEVGGYAIEVEELNDTQRSVTVTGYYPSNDANAAWYTSTAVEGTVLVGEPAIFTHAIFAANEITLNGENPLVDSYDSRENGGVYDAAYSPDNGDIGSNGTSTGVVDIGNGNIQGDVEAGPGADIADAVDLGPGALVEGQITTMSSEKDLDLIEAPDGLANAGDMTITRGTTTLAAGTYYYNDISISGRGALAFSGPVTLYISGSLSIAGNGVQTSSNIPTNLVIYVESTEDVHIAGNGNFYGAVYAPQSEVTVSGNGGLYGAVIAYNATLNGRGGVHYDEALSEMGIGGGETTLQFWGRPDSA